MLGLAPTKRTCHLTMPPADGEAFGEAFGAELTAMQHESRYERERMRSEACYTYRARYRLAFAFVHVHAAAVLQVLIKLIDRKDIPQFGHPGQRQSP